MGDGARRGNNCCELYPRYRKAQEKGEGGCCCVIDSRIGLPVHCAAASVDFPLWRVYSRSVAGANGKRGISFLNTQKQNSIQILYTAMPLDNGANVAQSHVTLKCISLSFI